MAIFEGSGGSKADLTTLLQLLLEGSGGSKFDFAEGSGGSKFDFAEGSGGSKADIFTNAIQILTDEVAPIHRAAQFAAGLDHSMSESIALNYFNSRLEGSGGSKADFGRLLGLLEGSGGSKAD